MGWIAQLWLCSAVHSDSHAEVHAKAHADAHADGKADIKHLKYGFGACSGTMEEIAVCEAKECAHKCIDCEWDEWSDYASCSCEGLQERFRSIKIKNSDCGRPCAGNRVETKSCVPKCHHSPVDCVLGVWSMAATCDKDCGGGQSFRERAVIKESAYGGKPCNGALKESLPCNEQLCYSAQDCELSPWTPWGECSASCDGTQRRSRSIETPALYGGRPCDDVMAETRPCNQESCGDATVCLWHNWEEWNTCSVSCGGGERSRSRSVKQSPRLGGRLCEPKALMEVNACHTEPCGKVVDCEFGEWGTWDGCSCSCNGVQHRARHVEKFAQNNGKLCTGTLREIRGCNQGSDHCEADAPSTTTTTTSTTPAKAKARIVDCALSDWSSWEACSASCGGGIRVRSRRVLVEPSPTGEACEAALESVESCHTEDCPQETTTPPAGHTARDCVMSKWEEWSTCSVSCGGGEHTRNRQIQNEPNALGKPCPSGGTLEVAACNTQACQCKDCQWGPWGDWGPCVCTGLQDRHRAVLKHNDACGKPCTGPKSENQKCQPDCGGAKTRDCELAAWSNWSGCTATCGGGTQQRDRAIAHEALHGGEPCKGDLVDVVPCSVHACGHLVDCVVSEWTEWSLCTAKSDGGQQERSRSIMSEANDGGETCSAGLKETRGCNTQSGSRAQDCKWGEWSEYSACSESCGGGHRNRDRSIAVAPRFGGKLCDAKTKSETVPCNTQTCDSGCKDAKWGLWTKWGDCTASCGESYRTRSRKIVESANDCGKPLAGDMQEFEPCEPVECGGKVQDCTFSPWSDWGDCSCSCDGVRDRERRITAYDQNGGKACAGGLKQVVSCNTNVCNAHRNQDCELSEWAPWTACNAKCGGGQRTRNRDVIHKSSGSGAPCEARLGEMEGCNTQECLSAIDCAWGEWNDWGACSHKCDGGHQTRIRHIVTLPKKDGKACAKGASTEVQQCNMHVCGAVHYCAWGKWSSWSGCSEPCGKGEKKRKRTLEISLKKPDEEVLFAGALDQVNPGEGNVRVNVANFLGVFVAGLLFSSMLLTTYSRWRHRQGFHAVSTTD